MKRIKIGKLMIAAAVVFSANVAFGARGLGDPTASADKQMNKTKKPEAVSILPARYDAISVYGHSAGLRLYDIKGTYAYNKAGIVKYGSAVIIDNYKVDKLKGDLKVARKNHDKKDVLVLKRKLKKARNDLFRDQVHLMVDKEALRQDYKLTIGDFKQELNGDRKDLYKAKSEIRKDKSDLKAQKIALSKEKEIKADKAAIYNERVKLKEDMARVNEIFKK